MAKWSEERKNALKSMWLSGSTSTEISIALGEVTRNAVMGMVHRMGLMGAPSHAAHSKARMSGCCVQGWRRSTSGSTQGPTDIPAAIAVPVEAARQDVTTTTDVETAIVVDASPTDDPSVDVPDPAVTRDADPVLSVEEVVQLTTISDDASVARALIVIEASDASVSNDPEAMTDPEAVAAPGAVAAPEAVVAPGIMASSEETPAPEIAIPAAEAAEENVSSHVSAPSETSEAPSAADDDFSQDNSPDPVSDVSSGVERIRRVMEAKAKAAPKPRTVRVPSSRAWSAPPSSRMPPRASEIDPPAQVVISPGVMSALRTLQPGTSEWRDAFSLLRDLTGVSYDARVPGHLPALVAIATVLARGDPRSVLSPRIPEQSVLRVMRSFAEKGIVVAGKPPSRWIEDVDDRAFYDEMVQLAAAA